MRPNQQIAARCGLLSNLTEQNLEDDQVLVGTETFDRKRQKSHLVNSRLAVVRQSAWDVVDTEPEIFLNTHRG
jgi:hypothetical protein